MPDLAVLRAWWTSHRAPSAGGSMAVVALATVAFADLDLATWDEATPVPLWVLLPGLLSLLASGLTEDLAAGLEPRGPTRLRVLRAAWAVTVSCAAALLAVPTGLEVLDPDVAWAAGLLTALTFGLSAAIGKGSALLGASVCAVGVTMAGQVPARDKWAWVLEQLPPGGAVALAVVTLAGLAWYAAAGPPRRPSGDGPA